MCYAAPRGGGGGTLSCKLLENHNIFIKDLSSKKGFENGGYIRLAVRNKDDNDALIAALKDILQE